MKMEQTECSETPAYNIQTPGNYPPEGNIQNSEHGESLKSRNQFYVVFLLVIVKQLYFRFRPININTLISFFLPVIVK
jgi:hypothetical protein